MIANVNVSGALMMDRVVHHTDCTLVATCDSCVAHSDSCVMSHESDRAVHIASYEETNFFAL